MEMYERASVDYQVALNKLQHEDTKLNRINALEKGRILAALNRHFSWQKVCDGG